MKTNLSDEETKAQEDLNRVLLFACGGIILLANHWRLGATDAIQKGQTLKDFVLEAQPTTRSRAKAAYMLAAWEVTQ